MQRFAHLPKRPTSNRLVEGLSLSRLGTAQPYSYYISGLALALHAWLSITTQGTCLAETPLPLYTQTA